jgi:hypothetical protein
MEAGVSREIEHEQREAEWMRAAPEQLIPFHAAASCTHCHADRARWAAKYPDGSIGPKFCSLCYFSASGGYAEGKPFVIAGYVRLAEERAHRKLVRDEDDNFTDIRETDNLLGGIALCERLAQAKARIAAEEE